MYYSIFLPPNKNTAKDFRFPDKFANFVCTIKPI